MSHGNYSVADRGRAGGCIDRSAESVRRFLRLGHILSSVLGEILDGELQRGPNERPLTRAQFCFLKLINLNSGLKVGQVARRLGVTAAATSKSLDRLERLGLVSRAAVPGDRRASSLSPSPDGRALVCAFERSKVERVEPVVADLEPHELEQLCGLLERVCLGLLENLDGRGDPCLRCAGYYKPGCTIGALVGRCGFEAQGSITQSSLSGGGT